MFVSLAFMFDSLVRLANVGYIMRCISISVWHVIVVRWLVIVSEFLIVILSSMVPLVFYKRFKILTSTETTVG